MLSSANTTQLELPYPPADLMRRVGHGNVDDTALQAAFEQRGRTSKQAIDAALHDMGWDRTGKRILDFGCGSGRLLRHFAADPRGGTFVGCELDAPSVAWCSNNFPDSFSFHVSDAFPPLPIESGSIDCAVAISVFTHLPNSSLAWLAEMHRVLAPGGILLATWFGEPYWSYQMSHLGPWNESVAGMRIALRWQSWTLGGPSVAMSQWWLREHWGRAFDVIRLEDRGFAKVDDGPAPGQGLAILQKKDIDVTEQMLREPRDPRETAALLDTIEFLERDSEVARDLLDAERAARQQANDYLNQVTALAEQLAQRVQAGNL